MHNLSMRCSVWYPPATPTSKPSVPPGEVWQSHGKWILARKRFKAFMVLSVFQAAASPGFDGLFSRFICGFSWSHHCWGLTAGAQGHRAQFLFIKYKTLICPAATPVLSSLFLSLTLHRNRRGLLTASYFVCLLLFCFFYQQRIKSRVAS